MSEDRVYSYKAHVLDAFPTSWLDPLLTGNGTRAPLDCPGVERLLAGLKERIAKRLDAPYGPSSEAWIPVSERLPSMHSDDDRICATRTGFVCALRFGEDGWYDSVGGEDTGKDGYWNGCVTHWMPLPNPPHATRSGK